MDQFESNPFDTLSENSIETIDAVAVSPISLTNFKPLEENTILCQISPAKFDSLLKVLNVLVSDKSSNDSLIIKESTITQNVSGAIISSNIEEIFEGKKIDLQIINPKKYLRLFKTFRNNNDIFILDDPENSRFIVTNGEIKLFLPKQIESLVEAVKLPDLSNCTGMCSIKVDKATRNIITGLASEASYIDYLIQDDLLKAIHIPDTAIYLFSEYINDSKATKLDETNADLALRSTVYFTIPAEDYEIAIGKQPDGSYISAMSCNTGFIKVDVIESLEVTTGGNILI
ncbi:MAG TPA: hypothetical protein PLL26_05930 [Candidatus Dojkabacteria bacterium]|nr:hypothetical protein [Candidatus Dojkabacteria bacterium]